MEIGKYVKIFLGILIGTLAVPILAFAYANQTTHPALTDEAVDLFNNYYAEQKISDADKNLIKQGSVEEDEAPRWMNHFYDPINNAGLWGYDSSKIYAQAWPNTLTNPNTKPLSLEGQYIWQRAVYDYAYGNKNYAMLTLGHILHLIEDKAVPDHTRNDAHPPVFDQESPYENWASQFDDSNVKITADLINKNMPPIILGSLNDYFDGLANYSNKNFFSKDTILSNDYADPKALAEQKIGNLNFIVGNDNKILLAKKTSLIDPKTSKISSSYSLDEENYLLPAYWSHLSPQAVQYSAGVIKLFFDEVEKEKQNKILLSRNMSLKDIAASKIKNTAGAILSFFKNNLNFSVDKNVLTSSVANIPPEPTKVDAQPTQPQKPKPVSILNNENVLAIKPETILQNNPEPIANPAPEQTPPANLLAVSLPYPGYGGGGYIAPSAATLGAEPEIILETSTTTSSTTPEIIIDETPPETATTTATTTPPASTESGQAEEIIIPEIPEPLSVVINEVAWAGNSSDTSSDEWIELYNNTSEEINLSGWILYSATNDKGVYLNLSGAIAAKSFYLIERTDDNTVSDIAADFIAPFGNGLSNGGESLVLSYASTTIDQTHICESPILNTKWPPGHDYKYRSMERIDTNTSGNIFSNWGTAIYPSIIHNGKNSKGVDIIGTPKARNSVTYLINGNGQSITTDITLTKANSPYVVNDTSLSITNGATLTIEPGVIIKFYGGSNITVFDGKLLAQGTSEEKIIFTSYYDDEHGGDMDGAPLTEPWNQYGGWGGIAVYAPGTILDNVLIRGGSGGIYPNSPVETHTALVARDFPLSLKNSTIEFSWYKGFELANSTSTIENNIFQFNDYASAAGSTGVVVYGGNINLLSNKFLNNKTGLEINSGTGVVDGNVFENNETNLKNYATGISFTNNVGIENDAVATTTPTI